MARKRWNCLVKVRSTKRVRMFAKHVEKVTELAAELIVKEDVPKFLSSKHPLLDKKSPIQMMWQEGEKGFRKVTEQLEGAATGSFS